MKLDYIIQELNYVKDLGYLVDTLISLKLCSDKIIEMEYTDNFAIIFKVGKDKYLLTHNFDIYLNNKLWRTMDYYAELYQQNKKLDEIDFEYAYHCLEDYED